MFCRRRSHGLCHEPLPAALWPAGGPSLPARLQSGRADRCDSVSRAAAEPCVGSPARPNPARAGGSVDRSPDRSLLPPCCCLILPLRISKAETWSAQVQPSNFDWLLAEPKGLVLLLHTLHPAVTVGPSTSLTPLLRGQPLRRRGLQCHPHHCPCRSGTSALGGAEGVGRAGVWDMVCKEGGRGGQQRCAITCASSRRFLAVA
jgi:hypothetical protein